ncbi:phosphate ABC transporter permease [Sphingopyxis sp. H038]|uniref:phosphate ABC transporter permease PstA n=1 Tax=unclassified Sphingopyxis TaxID=2614943 RepID=UPI00073129C6|nr:MULTISPECIES: phosphate ABC transporter permease PstA [unclassified Sphingopyxis]KTE03152.1 phosphate ABC transporter permease [Sphingopyxis sp. H012]KTE08500.1 phosphate ABC transporter permease [Sphingopyxis sp. H093]KTE10530.1 phosphate ABC transporter permease [Sphingopyxis sp. H053]KTE28688.1 phosphate ABC transporter permease [Sphingopyxis sp. H080]KTE36134.1 phosphate ABC transporter permease [Sphingopyxis sp. H038]
MNRQTAPTDWKGAVMQSRIAKRYAAERRFKLMGLGAVLLSGAFLAFLLFVMVGNGARGFMYTHVAVPVDFKAMPLTIDTSRLGDADADQVIANAGLADIVAFAADEALGPDGSKLISENAWKEVRSAIKDDPELLGGKTVFELPAASEVDIAAKEGAKGALGAKVDALEKDGKLSTGIHWPFFKNADATDPAVAGIWGALKGSVLTIFIAFLIAFPTGVLAALYLEEYAPKNRWTDLIEVSINNLAAVPSIIFGLLALAVFINWFGLCQASPLVGGLTLALMTMPVIVIASRNAIKSVPPSIRDAALGVGASPVQVVFHHVLPLALPGILTGTIIGMARALGETAPLLLVGMRAFIGDVPGGICSPSTLLPMQIFLWSDEVDRGFVEKTSAAIIVLLIVLLSMNAFAIYLRNKFEKRW